MAGKIRGIRRLVQLILDKSSAKKTELAVKRSLERGTDPKKPRRNLQLIERGMGRIKQAALGVGAAMVAAFGARAVIRFLRDSVRVANEAEEIWNRLGGSVRQAGGDFELLEPKIRAVAAVMQRATKVGDEDFATIFQELLSTTNDLPRSLQNVAVVADLAAAKQLDLRTAAQLVGRAMVGQTSTLTRYGIVIQEGADAVEVLRERFAGMAANEVRTLHGQTVQLTNAWADLKEAIGGVIGDISSGESVLESLTRKVQLLTIFIEENAAAWDRVGRFSRAFYRFFTSGPIGAILKAPGKFFGFQELSVDINRMAVTVDELQANVDLLVPALAELAAVTNFGTEGTRAQKDEYQNLSRVLEVQRERIAKLIAAEKELDRIRNTNRPGSAGAGASTGIELPARRGGLALPGRPDPIQPVGPARTIGQTQLESVQEHADLIRDEMFSIESAAHVAAAGVIDAFGGAFAQLFEDGATVGSFFSALFAGVAQAGLGAVASYASGKVAENIAASFEAKAKGLALLANPFTAPAAGTAFAAAKAHLVAAAKWGVLAGAASALGGAVGSGGGGGSGNFAGGDRRSTSSNFQGDTAGAEIHVHIDPFDPRKPVHQKLVLAGVQFAQQRFGEGTPITVHGHGRR